jgi:hypothetical protein
MRSWLLILAIGCGSPRTDSVDPPPDPDSSTTDPDSTATVDAPKTDAPPVELCPATTWCRETSPVTATILTSVWVVDATDVFAVGDGGVIVRRRNNVWSQETSGTTANLRGVWAANATDVWAVGEGGTVLRSNGTTWTAVSGFTSDFKSIWGSGPDDVWLASFGKVTHWDGMQFTTKTLTGTLLSVHGTAGNDVWVTGEDARVDHFTGAWTTNINPGGGNSYFAIHALGVDNVMVAGLLETRQFDGMSWTSRSAPGSVFLSFFSTGATNLWAVGGTKAGRFDGSGWSIEAPNGASADLRSISGAGPHVWVVGSDGTESLILHRN